MRLPLLRLLDASPELRRGPVRRLLLPSLVLLAMACGGEGDGPVDPPDPPGPPASVTVTPSQATLGPAETVQLSAAVRDADGNTLDVPVSWSTGDEGVATVSPSGLVSAAGPGSTSVTATAQSASGSASITVENAAPVVEIDAPADGSRVTAGDTVVFQATAQDPEDGELSADLSWTSDLDGPLGTGAELAVADLSEGVHTVSARVSDSQGAEGADTIALTVEAVSVNLIPEATIAAPADGAVFQEGDTVRFQGSGTDAEDGELAGDALSWTSDRDGVLGQGAEVLRADLSTGMHRVVLEATDSEGATGADTVEITVEVAGNEPPSVTITAPQDGATVDEGTSVGFAATASDPEDGDLSGTSVLWTSSLDGALGSGLTFSRTDLSAGTHRVVAEATDSQGAAAADTVELTVASVGGAGPVATLELQPDFVTVDVGATADGPFAVTARDAGGGVVADPGTSWASAASGTAQVDGAGNVTGVASGTAEIVATAETVSDTALAAVAGPEDLVATALADGAWSLSAAVGTTFQVPVVLDLSRVSSEGDVGAVQLEITWDPAVLEVVDSELGFGTGAINTDEAGRAAVALVDTSPQGTATVVLVTLTLRVVDGAAAGAGTTLALAFPELIRTDFSPYETPLSVGARVRVP